MNKDQKNRLTELRKSNILYTVLGQKVFFFAIARFLLRVRSEYRTTQTLDAILSSIKKMDDNGFLDRSAEHWSNILVKPNQNLQMITKGNGVENCTELVKMILLDSSEGVRDFIKRARDNIGNEISWSETLIAEWRKEYRVVLPKVDLIEDEINSLAADVLNTNADMESDFSDENESNEEFNELEYEEDIFMEAE